MCGRRTQAVRERPHGLLDGGFDRLLILFGVLQYLRERHLAVRLPHVVVGDAGDRRVRDLRLAGELRLRDRGHHADQVPPLTLVKLRLRTRRVLRALDADVGAALHDVRVVGGVTLPVAADGRLRGLGEVIDQLGAVRVRERLVDDDAVAVKERSRCFVRS